MSLFKAYKVVVVEDEPIILENIIQKIENGSPFFTVAGSARNGIDAVSVIDSIKPDVLFTDIRMPKMDGLELIKIIKEKYSNMQVVILSGFNEFDYAQQAIKLGVKEYLLKPINIDLLYQTLTSIKSILDLSASKMERDILFSGVNGLTSVSILPHNLSNEHFGIYLICIGHLCNLIQSSKQLEYFANTWSRIDWKNILPYDAKWWIIDEKRPNQKCLVLTTENTEKETNPVSILLKNSLSNYLEQLPVNICAGDSFIPYVDIWPLTQKLRILLDQSLILGKSAIFTPSTPNISNIAPAILDLTFQNKIIALINQRNTTLLQQELFLQFNKWEQSQYPQRWVEKVLHQLLIIFQRQFPSISEEEISQMEYELNEKLTISPDFSYVYDDIWHIFSIILSSSEKEKDNTKGLIDIIEEYINSNYCSDLSLEDIARKFSFSPTYLTKVFKKLKGETPSKYIIILRINEAKRLIETHPEMDIKRISEIIGYTDPQYFSRIFKIVTNLTPTEYRESVSNISIQCCCPWVKNTNTFEV